MSIFSKLFGSSNERETRRILTEISQKVEKEHKPMGELSLAIIRAATNCRDAVKGKIIATDDNKKIELEVYVFYEFIYFYMHLTMRFASVQLTEPQIEKLQSFLGPLISSTAIDSYFAHWPDDLKQKMRSDFFGKLNDAEMEYAQCTQFNSAEQGDKQFAQKFLSLFMKLGTNVSNLSGREENDLEFMKLVVDTALDEWKKMNLENLIGEVKKVPTSH